MILVKPKAETREAWQCRGSYLDAPQWVVTATRLEESGLWLIRRSGKQFIKPGEWLIRNLDGEPEWLTHEQMRKTFDEVVRAGEG